MLRIVSGREAHGCEDVDAGGCTGVVVCVRWKVVGAWTEVGIGARTMGEWRR